MEVENIFGIFLITTIAIFLFLDRKNIEVKGIILLRRTNKLNAIVEKISTRYSKILNFLGQISIFSVFVSFGIFLYFSIQQIFQPPKIAPVQILLPSIPGICSSSFILCVPAHLWLIIVPIVAFSHEFLHAFIAKANGIKIKSVGYAFILIFPAFFVEINDKSLKKADLTTRLKVYSVGSFGNFLMTLIALLFLLFISFLISKNFGGLMIETINNTPAYYSNLSGILLKINNIEINNLNDLIRLHKKFMPKQSITIETSEKIYNITLDENATIGIKIVGEAYYPKTFFAKKYKNIILPILLSMREFFFWLLILNFGVGLFNLLPIKPLDGGLFFSDLLERKFKKGGKVLYNLLSFSTLIIFLILILRYILKI